ncbi:penicillin-binding protein [Paenibacillus baekrokdamisoli]|uniref:Penicillin-binding protein n=1 Tax=Paenibacillus baekrokdamisoli TaxID=1712516 RepID=A0A3G9JBI4_9BACL|nr:penicillin-binding transpeptidase domain-containing protein [Paenibacillus baekrokdamisoli]MBB3070223.1 penicillin-binding protein 2B [Paenibacillus baekrokdamisoli]BBH21228.1 penicillin-binding protein [Paenibacillus baekrokdamisoli]
MTKRIKLRTLLVGGLITLLFVVLVGRIYWVQVVNADFWSEKAREVWSKSEKLFPVRGTIEDRDGAVLAMDVAAYTVIVKPKVIHKLNLEAVIVSKLHLVLGKPEAEIRSLIEAKNKDGNYFDQREVRKEGYKIDKSVADRLERFKDELEKQTGEKDNGIFLTTDTKRYYPNNNLASHILGYLNRDGKPIMGLEASLNKQLTGEEGEIKYQKDGNGVILENGTVSFKPSHDGDNIKLTIDMEIQHYLEEAIKEAYVKYQPKSITAIAADPQTMEILGMANLPDFNPNEYWKAAPVDFYDHSIKSLYEPGSTFKIVTLAGAVQEGLFDPEAKYQSGVIKIAGSPIHDHNRAGWGTITYLEGLKRSSNVAFVKLGYEMLKADRLMDYIKKFGFSQKTGIELNGELAGVVNPTYATEVATAAFGQGKVLVTPIQQVAAVAAVANGGKLLVPHLVKEIEDPVTKKVTVTKPVVVRQVISEKSAKQVDEYLEQVVSDQKIGTGKNAYIEGYRVAGKTGTAQKVVKGKGYSSDKYVVSFIGFAPVGNPKIVVYVVVDEPNDKFAGGGTVAAPVFKQIVLQSLRHMGVSPVVTTVSEAQPKGQTVTVPDLADQSLNQAQAQLKSRALAYEVVGKGSKVLQQIPKAGTAVAPAQRVYLLTEERSKLPIPNMKGLSLRDALEICSILQMRCYTVGEGFVSSQILAKQNGENVLKLMLAPPDAELQTTETVNESGKK